jgi:hypothetical protein
MGWEWGREVHTEIWWGNMVNVTTDYLGLGGRIILKWTLMK